MLVNSPSMLYLAAVTWPILAVLPCRYRPLWFWRCNSSTPCCISLIERAKRTLPDLTSAVCIEFITLVVSMYSLVLFFTGEIVTVGRPWIHLLGNHLQVGGAELVGDQLDRFGVAVVDLAIESHRRRGQSLAGRQGQGAGRKGQDQRAAPEGVSLLHGARFQKGRRR